MTNYQNAEKLLKVSYENIWVLHHNIISKNFPPDHENMEKYYELALDCADSIIENGISIGIPEVSIAEALEDVEALPIRKYPKVEAYQLVRKFSMRLLFYWTRQKKKRKSPTMYET